MSFTDWVSIISKCFRLGPSLLPLISKCSRLSLSLKIVPSFQYWVSIVTLRFYGNYLLFLWPLFGFCDKKGEMVCLWLVPSVAIFMLSILAYLVLSLSLLLESSLARLLHVHAYAHVHAKNPPAPLR